MNPKRTWYLLAAALALFLFIYFYEGRKPQTQPLTGLAARLFPKFSPAAATSVEVILQTNQVLRVERTNENWRLVLPIVSPAYTTRIDSLLNVFSQLSEQFHLSTEEILTQKLAAFGLDPPQATLTVWQGRARLELRVGRPTPAGDKVYVQLVGTDGVFFTDPAFLDRLPRSVDDWRDPTFLPLKGLVFNRLKVETRKGSTTNQFEFQREATTQVWRLRTPMDVRADNRKLEKLFRDLRAWQVSRFLPDTPKPDLEPYGLQPPEVALTFGQDTNDVLVAQFGRSPTNDLELVYARCLTQANAVLVPKGLLDQLRANYVDFRDRRLLAADLTAVDRIEVRAEDTFTVRRQTNGGWWLLEQNVPADPLLMTNFLGNLRNLEILDFDQDLVTDFSQKGLLPPSRQYLFRQTVTNEVVGISNRLVAELDVGTNQADKVYARVLSEASVYTIRLDASQLLPVNSLQLRNRRLWDFKTNEVQGLTVTIKDQSRKFVRSARGQWSLVPAQTALEFPLSYILEELCYRLGTLRAEAWTARGDAKLAWYGFPKIDHRLDLDVSPGSKAQKLSLRFGSQAPSGNPYAATALPDVPTAIFEFNLSLFQLYSEVLRSPPVALLPPLK